MNSIQFFFVKKIRFYFYSRYFFEVGSFVKTSGRILKGKISKTTIPKLIENSPTPSSTRLPPNDHVLLNNSADKSETFPAIASVTQLLFTSRLNHNFLEKNRLNYAHPYQKIARVLSTWTREKQWPKKSKIIARNFPSAYQLEWCSLHTKIFSQHVLFILFVSPNILEKCTQTLYKTIRRSTSE